MKEDLELYVRLVRAHDFDHVAADIGLEVVVPREAIKILYRESPVAEAGATCETDSLDLIVYRVGLAEVEDDAVANALAASDPIAETIDVSHELGHHYCNVRDLGDHRSSLPAVQLKNEVFAWEAAKLILQQYDFAHWDRFNARRSESLLSYCTEFRIPPSSLHLLESEAGCQPDLVAIQALGAA